MTTEELIQKLGIAADQKDEALAAIREFLNGAYVPKSRFNEVNEEKNTLKAQVTERDKQLEVLKKAGGDAESLKTKITELQEANKTAQKDYEEKLKKIRLDAAIKIAIGDKAQDADIVSGLIDRNKLIVGDDGKITGISEQLSALQKDKAFLFKNEGSGYNPHGGKPPVKNPFSKESFNLTEQGKLFRENPEQARAMAAAAGVNI